jgi:uncharacterized repeat protein (TIGR03803 family)
MEASSIAIDSKTLVRICALFASFLLALAGNVNARAQSFTTIYSFSVPTNNTGNHPSAQLVQGADRTLYGTTEYGDGDIKGTVFKVGPDGSGFTVLKFFTNQLEGANPAGGLALSGTTLYGRTSIGGSSNWGTIFRISTDGTGYTVLKSFAGSDGSMARTADWWQPSGALLLEDNTLYGTTTAGGSSNGGTVFRMQVDGTGYTVLKHFGGSDGDWPIGALVADGGTLYGTTFQGGDFGYGTVFRVNTDGTGYNVLRSFASNEYSGWNPVGGLALKGNILYGTTADRGTEQEYYETGYLGSGTVFRINTDGTAYVILKKFTQADGFVPLGTLLLDGSVLYGTTYTGGQWGGTVFKMNTDATGYAVLLNFGEPNADGTGPYSGLVLNGGTLYGTTFTGSPSESGTLFKVNTDGTGYTHLVTFGILKPEYPHSGVTASGNTLYGTTTGFYWNGGSVYKVNADGSGYTTLKRFIRERHMPSSGVVVSGNSIYGTTSSSGSSSGVLFKLSTDGNGFTVVKDFVFGDGNGQYPSGYLVLNADTLYGTTTQGGSSGQGTVYKIHTDGTGYTVLKSFGGTDGSYPFSGLILDNNTLYGASIDALYKLNPDGSGFAVIFRLAQGMYVTPPVVRGNALYATSWFPGTSEPHKVFKINTDGTGYMVLKSFLPPENGAFYLPGLTVNGNWLYGSAIFDGITNYGMLFKLNTDGSSYSVLRNFAGYDGADPLELESYGDLLYGITQRGGDFDRGTIFKIDLTTPFITIQSLGCRVVLSWENPAFQLQSSGNPAGSFTNISGATSPFTNTITGSQLYFRLANLKGL